MRNLEQGIKLPLLFHQLLEIILFADHSALHHKDAVVPGKNGFFQPVRHNNSCHILQIQNG